MSAIFLETMKVKILDIEDLDNLFKNILKIGHFSPKHMTFRDLKCFLKQN